MRTRDLTFERFGSLVAIHRSIGAQKNRVYWLARCDCGKAYTVSRANLCSGSVKSCGCVGRKKTIERNTTHGMSNSPEYKIWAGMKSRCHNPSDTGYDKYGARGISVSDEWRKDFNVFLKDMGVRPTENHTIERKDVYGGYCKENCVWILANEQQNNTRRNVVIDHQGRSMNLTQWAREKGISVQTLHSRIFTLEWGAQKALTKPIYGHESRKPTCE